MSQINRSSLALWSVITVVSVLLLFQVFHSVLSHALAIVLAGGLGIAIAWSGYRLSSGDRSPRGAAVAGAVGGGLGLVVLHVFPLLH